MSDLLTLMQSIASANAYTTEPPARFNPRPPGVIREGSSSDQILKFMRSSPGMKTEAQLRRGTKLGHSAVSWSLMYLLRQGLIEYRPDIARNARYRRYQIKHQSGEQV